MRKTFIAVCFVFSILPACAQRADMRIAALINASDWFALEEEYPVLKDSVQMQVLKSLSEAMLDTYFNRPEQAIEKIKAILSNHKNEMDSASLRGLHALAIMTDGKLGNYARAADSLNVFLKSLAAIGGKEELEYYQDLYKHFDELRKVPAPSVSRPQKDIEVPVSIEKLILPVSVEPKGYRGAFLKIPVTIHGKTYQFIFDTGASTTFVSERFARKIGVRIFGDTVTINKNMIGESHGMRGILDSVQIGPITFRNALVHISPPNASVDSIVQIDAVLGIDFMNLMKEFQIYVNESKLVFPYKPTPLPVTGRNMLLNNATLPILKTYAGKVRLLFSFDTGNTTADLFYTYYTKHQQEIDRVSVKDSITGGGFGFVRTKEILCLPSISFNVGKTPVVMKAIRVHPTADRGQSSEDGNMGMDLIRLFSKVTVNLKDMFVDLK